MKTKNIDILDRMAHYKVQGVGLAIIDNGRLMDSKEYGTCKSGTDSPVKSTSIFNACSISKLAASLLTLRLVDEGILRLDEPVNKNLKTWKVPENNFTQNKSVTLRWLLSHGAGLADPAGSFCEYNFEAGVPNLSRLLNGDTHYCGISTEIKSEPGSLFEYSDLGYCIIEALIEDTTGKKYSDIIDEKLFTPLNMKNSSIQLTPPKNTKGNFVCGHDKHGCVVHMKYPSYPYAAAAGLWSTATDLSRMVIEILDALHGNSRLGISRATAQEMIRPQGSSDWAGLGLIIRGEGPTMRVHSYGWGVGYQCMIEMFPHLNAGAVIMTNTDLGFHQIEGLIGEIFSSL